MRQNEREREKGRVGEREMQKNFKQQGRETREEEKKRF